MNSQLLYSLVSCETDVDGALRRFCGDEALYISCLGAFLEDRTLYALDDAIELHAWDDAFTAAHALKGLAGNMGFIPLFHSVGELVVLIRSGRISELAESYRQVRRCYDEIVAAIRIGNGAAV